MLLVCIIGTLLLLLFDYIVFRNIKTPVLMYGFIWFLVYVSLLAQDDDFILQNPLLPSFLIAFLLFMVGFRLVNNRPELLFNVNSDVVWNPSLKKIIFGIEYVFSIVAFIGCYSMISISRFSAWQTIRLGMAEENIFPAWIGVAINFVRVVFFISFVLYLYTPNLKNKIDLLVSLPPLLLTCFFTTRGDWFFIIITLVYLMIFVKKLSNRQVFLLGLLSFICICSIFYFSSLDKYKFAYTEMNDMEKMRHIFSGYFINPVLNFFYWFSEDPEYALGKYTFRFFTALVHPFFPSVNVVDTVLPFKVIYGVKSNVYTALNWCARDFGIWWALIVQFYLGIFYGMLYKNVTKDSSLHIISLITLCMLMHPIVNQFFDDKIFSIISILLQRFIFLFVLVKYCLVVKNRFS